MSKAQNLSPGNWSMQTLIVTFQARLPWYNDLKVYILICNCITENLIFRSFGNIRNINHHSIIFNKTKSYLCRVDWIDLLIFYSRNHRKTQTTRKIEFNNLELIQMVQFSPDSYKSKLKQNELKNNLVALQELKYSCFFCQSNNKGVQ